MDWIELAQDRDSWKWEVGIWTGSSWLRIETAGSGMWDMDWFELAQDRDSWEWDVGIWTGSSWLRIETAGSGMWGYGLDRAGSG